MNSLWRDGVRYHAANLDFKFVFFDSGATTRSRKVVLTRWFAVVLLERSLRLSVVACGFAAAQCGKAVPYR